MNNMEFMFYKASNYNQPLSDWNSASVTNMNNMFRGASKFNQTLNDLNVSSVMDMSSMFRKGYGMYTQAMNFNQAMIGMWQV